MERYDALIVGAGFAGAVLAERLATELNKKVLIIDKREHLAGHCYGYNNSKGILIHKYGPHLFHTNDDNVVRYLSQFTQWRPFELRVASYVNGTTYPFPINRTTLNQFFKVNLQTETAAENFLAKLRQPIPDPQNAEEAVLARAGTELYNSFFKNYTIKQWQCDPKELDASVTMRIPIRVNTDDRYLTENFQAVPLEGYARLFSHLLDNPKITIELETNFTDIKDRVAYNYLIYTGCIDEFFDYKLGRLSYRSLEFKEEHYRQKRFQAYPTVNYPNDYDFTRIVEYKHITGQLAPWTTIIKEYPRSEGEPFYPVPTPYDREIYEKYKLKAEKLKNVFFIGRLAQYRYLNMDQVVKEALDSFSRLKEYLAN